MRRLDIGTSEIVGPRASEVPAGEANGNGEDLPVLRSQLLAQVLGIAHGITSRVPGLDRADGNVGYGAPRDREDAWEMRRRWCAAMGLDATRIATAVQIHGANVLRLGRRDAGRGALPGSDRVGLSDGLITDEPGVVLMTLHADCLPILMVDPRRPALAAVHAGWRGTVADVAGAAVAGLVDAFESRPADLLAFIGPGIGLCCYDVGADVIAAWRERAGSEAALALGEQMGRVSFDLPAANALQLRRAGVQPSHIEASGICTRCAGDAWFSHRGQGPETGRFGAFLALTS